MHKQRLAFVDPQSEHIAMACYAAALVAADPVSA
jgi:hypothetical protein